MQNRLKAMRPTGGQIFPGKGWNIRLRGYGSLEPWFDMTREPGEFELLK